MTTVDEARAALLAVVQRSEYADIHDDDLCKRDAHGCRCACHLADALIAAVRAEEREATLREAAEAVRSCAVTVGWIEDRTPLAAIEELRR